MSQASNNISTQAPSETHWDPANYGRTARFVSDLGESVLQLLAPQPGERILDLGCGDGALSRRIAASGASVLGADPSPDFVSAAIALGLDARLMSGETLTFAEEFDAVFSNAALHWVRGQDEMLSGVRRALKPGGRFVAEFGGAGNVAIVRAATVAALARRGIDGVALDPWYFPTPDAYRARLERNAYQVQQIALIDRPTPLPGGLADWLETFAQSFLAPLSGPERETAKSEIEAETASRLKGADGIWRVDYVRLRLYAVKPT